MATTEQYIVSARKYRPATFQSVVGQRALTTTLKNAILGGKLAQAYLFCGPRGVGKTSCARIFAKTINCLHPTQDGEACGECESCKAIERGNSFNLVELDAASNNSVEDIRNISEQVNIPAQDGRYRVFIIDEVHMLSNNAFNAFLKTLEEPPKNVVFILATTERHKVIPTILSRCQIYDFRRITVDDIIEHLSFVAEKEGVKYEREALGVIASKADGAMRDALSIFDQVVASTHGELTYKGAIDSLNVLDQDYYFRLVDIFRKGDVAEALLTFKEITDKGFDAQFFINGLASHIRNLMVCADPRTVVLLETSAEWSKKYNEQAPLLPVEWYYSAMKILNDADFNYRMSGNKRLLVELSLIRLSRLLNKGENTTTSKVSSPSSPAISSVSGNPSPGAAPFVVPEGERPHTAPEIKQEVVNYSGSKVESGGIRTNFSPSSRRTQSVKPKSFRLTEESAKQDPTVSDEPRNTTFSEEEFMKAWEEYAVGHPEQRILVAAMRVSKVSKLSDTAYSVEVDHPAQKQAFDLSIAEILEFFKKKLDNDFISLKVEITQRGEEERGMNSKDFLKLTVENNPELANFLKAIDAELE